MFKRFYPLLLAALVLALSISPALAQEGPTFGLSPEDLALLMGMSEAMQDVSSAAFTFDVTLSFNDPSANESGEVTVTGNGEWMLREEPGDYATHVYGTVSLPEAGTAPPMTSSFELIIIGQDIYMRAQDPETGEWSEWESLGEMMQAPPGVEGDIYPPIPLAQGGEINPEEAMALQQELSALASEMNLDSILTIERGADTTMDGQTIAIFNYNLNLMNLFGDPAFPHLFSRVMELSGTDMEEEAGMAPEQMLAMLTFLLADTTIGGQIGVGLDDSYMHLFSLNLAGSLEFGGMMGGMGDMGGAGAAQEEPVTFSLDLTLQYSDFNAQFDITPPT